MEPVLEFLRNFSGVILKMAFMTAVVMALVLLHRVLVRNLDQTSGKRFRNQVIMALSSLAGLLLIILALPIETSLRGQILALFGIVISATIALSSSTFLGNAMAGIMLKSVRNFRTGDFIQVGDYFGRVTERGLFHTEIQTPDRDLITLPNLLLATTAVATIRQSGTIISATVSLGYDVPRDKVEKVLVKAAGDIGLTEPFAQVKELGDFSITYRAAGLLTETKQIVTYRSRLRSGMVDALHGAGIEIVSPNFMNVRDLDPAQAFIPMGPAPRFTQTKDSAPVEVVFDKAEEAETTSTLRKLLEEKEQELKDARQEAKEEKGSDKEEGIALRIAKIEAEIAKTVAAVAQAEEKEKQAD